MSELNSLRQAIGISSTGFEISFADYKELLIFSATSDYDEFKQACDNIKCKYPTFSEFKEILAAAESDDDSPDPEVAKIAAAMLEHNAKHYPYFAEQSAARRKAGHERIKELDALPPSPTPDEIKAKRGDLSQVQAAKMVCVSTSTWRAWEYGQNPMPPGYWKLFLRETS